jgi:hypothetical protein
MLGLHHHGSIRLAADRTSTVFVSCNVAQRTEVHRAGK